MPNTTRFGRRYGSFKRTWLLAIATVAGCASNPQLSSTPWQRLLPGELADWDQRGDAHWLHKEGTIEPVAGSGLGYLLLPGEHGNLELEIEFWVASDTNSGVFIRCTDGSAINPDSCYEANIWDQHPNQSFRTGSIVTISEPLSIVQTVDQWNSMRIQAVNDHLRVWVNDIVTADVRDNRLEAGRIALQYGGEGMVRFRNIRIR